eukprot:g2082.t1
MSVLFGTREELHKFIEAGAAARRAAAAKRRSPPRSSIILSPNEEARVRQAEEKQRRLERLRQVREQESAVGSRLRSKRAATAQQRAAQRADAEHRDFEAKRGRRAKALTEKYQAGLEEVGQGHGDAALARTNAGQLARVQQVAWEHDRAVQQERQREAVARAEQVRHDGSYERHLRLEAKRGEIRATQAESSRIAAQRWAEENEAALLDQAPALTPATGMQEQRARHAQRSSPDYASTHFHSVFVASEEPQPEAAAAAAAADPSQTAAAVAAQVRMERRRTIEQEEAVQRREAEGRARDREREALGRQQTVKDLRAITSELRQLEAAGKLDLIGLAFFLWCD